MNNGEPLLLGMNWYRKHEFLVWGVVIVAAALFLFAISVIAAHR